MNGMETSKKLLTEYHIPETVMKQLFFHEFLDV